MAKRRSTSAKRLLREKKLSEEAVLKDLPQGIGSSTKKLLAHSFIQSFLLHSVIDSLMHWFVR